MASIASGLRIGLDAGGTQQSAKSNQSEDILRLDSRKATSLDENVQRTVDHFGIPEVR